MDFDLVITTGDLIAIGFGSLGLLGLWFAYRQISLSQNANTLAANSTRAGFALQVSQWFFDDRQTMKLFYRLDYDASEHGFVFTAESFPHSDDEYELDRLLYKLSHVGALVRREILKPKDIEGLRAIVRISLENEQLGNYLSWLQSKEQVPGHSDFLDAALLYKTSFPDRFTANEALSNYERNAERK